MQAGGQQGLILKIDKQVHRFGTATNVAVIQINEHDLLTAFWTHKTRAAAATHMKFNFELITGVSVPDRSWRVFRSRSELVCGHGSAQEALYIIRIQNYSCPPNHLSKSDQNAKQKMSHKFREKLTFSNLLIQHSSITPLRTTVTALKRPCVCDTRPCTLSTAVTRAESKLRIVKKLQIFCGPNLTQHAVPICCESLCIIAAEIQVQ